MTTPNRSSLWEVMQGAYFEGRNPGLSDRHGYAAEIRAVADAIPEEFYGANGVRAWLLEEADRAEMGLPDPQDEGPGFAADCASFLNKVA